MNEGQSLNFSFKFRKSYMLSGFQQKQKFNSLSLMVYVTDRCNLACDYCFVKQEPKDMDWDTAKATIEFAIEWAKRESRQRLISVNFFGGEPFLRAHDLLSKFMDYALRRGKEEGVRFHFGATTNGTLIDKYVDLIKKYNMSLLISIDGIEPAHDAHRKYHDGRGSFKDVVKGLDALRREGLRINEVRMNVTPENVKYLFESVKWLYEHYQPHSIPFVPIVELKWAEEDLKLYSLELKKVADYHFENINIGREFHIKIFDDFLKNFAKSGREASCGAGRGLLAISPEGEIYPCQEFYQFDKGKKKYLLGTVFEGITRPEIRDYFLELSPNKYAFCRGCPLLSVCGGGCIAHNYGFMGDPEKPIPNRCRLVRTEAAAFYYWLGKMQTTPQGRNYLLKIRPDIFGFKAILSELHKVSRKEASNLESECSLYYEYFA